MRLFNGTRSVCDVQAEHGSALKPPGTLPTVPVPDGPRLTSPNQTADDHSRSPAINHPRSRQMDSPDALPSTAPLTEADRRHHPRCTVKVQSEIRREGSHVPRRLETTDLSRGGCSSS